MSEKNNVEEAVKTEEPSPPSPPDPNPAVAPPASDSAPPPPTPGSHGQASEKGNISYQTEAWQPIPVGALMEEQGLVVCPHCKTVVLTSTEEVLGSHAGYSPDGLQLLTIDAVR